jgi:hypothetical protein
MIGAQMGFGAGIAHAGELESIGDSRINGNVNAALQRLFVYVCAISLPMLSTSILILQPDWTKAFLALSVLVALIGLPLIRVPRELYVRILVLSVAMAFFLIIKITHDWWFGLPIRPEGYLSLVVRLVIALIFAAALATHLRLMLRALCIVSVVVVIHAIIGDFLIAFVDASPAPILDAAEAGSFSYTQIAWTFFYGETMTVGDNLKINRAHGVMWEPGIFQFYSNYILVYGFSRFAGNRKRLFIALGIIGTILSTSTMGLIITVLVVLMNARFSWKVVLGIGALLGGPFLFLFASKFNIGTMESLSTVIRLVDLEVPLNYALEFPVLGVGNDPSVVNVLGVHSYLLDYLTGIGQGEFLSDYVEKIFDTERIFNTSNGLLALLMQYGAIFTLAYMTGVRNFVRWTRLGPSLFVLIFLTIVNEPISLTVLFLWFAVHGLVLPRWRLNEQGTPSNYSGDLSEESAGFA